MKRMMKIAAAIILLLSFSLTRCYDSGGGDFIKVNIFSSHPFMGYILTESSGVKTTTMIYSSVANGQFIFTKELTDIASITVNVNRENTSSWMTGYVYKNELQVKTTSILSSDTSTTTLSLTYTLDEENTTTDSSTDSTTTSS